MSYQTDLPEADLPEALVLYHFLHPDDVVSAVIFTELCTGLAERGWRVTGSSCNRSWNDSGAQYTKQGAVGGVSLRRIWRPGFRQSSGFGRMANALWMVGAWSLMAFDPRVRCKVLIMGTDPVLSPAVALLWRLVRPRVRIAHWCFDLYPEAAVAGGIFEEKSAPVRFFKTLMRISYRKCNLIVDLGVCMRRLLAQYGSGAEVRTIVPWALIESAQPLAIDAAERQELFGDAKLGLLYSGSFGRAHSWEGIPELARELAEHGCRVAFSVRGNAVDELRSSIGDSGTEIFFAPFAPRDRAQMRLGAADIHIVSLREDWTGTVVPSKFFSALAIGRPVLFIGSPDCAVAKSIETLQVGWVLTRSNREAVVAELVALAGDPEARQRLFERCSRVYWENFSRAEGLNCWDTALRGIL